MGRDPATCITAENKQAQQKETENKRAPQQETQLYATPTIAFSQRCGVASDTDKVNHAFRHYSEIQHI